MSLARRDFLRIGAVVAASCGAWPLQRAIARPIVGRRDDGFPIPADKGFDPAWVEALFARSEPTVYRSKAGELDTIGMPIGGVCCGQVYLGGDGTLWHWDIFNLPQRTEWTECSGMLYSKPSKRVSPIEQGFAIHVTADGASAARRLDATGFRDIEFRGQYPIGVVRYADEDCPVRVELEAFSPFCPLDEAASGTPTVVMNYTITNSSSKPVRAAIAGWLENAVCKETGKGQRGQRLSRVVHENFGTRGATTLEFAAAPLMDDAGAHDNARPDIVIEDWERGTYEGWEAAGTAFGDRPRARGDIAGYQGDLAMHGDRTVNSHETRHGEDVRAGDAHTGTLTSRPFTIERGYICFRIGGGRHPGQTCVNLVIDGQVVRTATGQDSNRMRLESFDVREFAGREARIQIVDQWTEGWGNIGCDEILQCDRPQTEPYDMARAMDFGSMSLSMIGEPSAGEGRAAGVRDWQDSLESPGLAEDEAASAFDAPTVVGFVRHREVELQPGESRTVTFVIAWWFPNPNREQLGFLTDIAALRRWYAGRFAGVGDVRAAIVRDLDLLASTTRLWRDTWYDSTLPHWFLDRTFANVSTAATATCWRFDNLRFYGWEGTYSCPGTCTHVWQYAQGLARVFPALERSTREMVDFGLAFREESGQIDYRAEAARDLAVDGQCGTILRAYREHQMSTDGRFLSSIWPRVKRAIECMLARDPDANGILDGPQYNTLDTTWYGEIAWLSSLYLAAVRAGEAMADEMGDANFADRCRQVADRGRTSMVERLFNGEYFIHKTDPAHPEANSTGTGCHIDQLLGQSWAHQVGLGRIVPLDESRSALRSLYTYSFAPNIGPYRKYADKIIKGGRWYALPGEGGLLMCTWPKGGTESATGKGGDAWAAGYFNECMTGFEHQVASHMIAEGMLTEGLAITRMIHDRYHATRRNPWNEIECGNHYARAMASYGSFITMCGFEHHGPRGVLGFAPRLTPENFRCAFIAAGGWGQYRQRRDARSLRASVEVRWGEVRLNELRLEAPAGWVPSSVSGTLAGERIACSLEISESHIRVRFNHLITIAAGQTLDIDIGH